MEDNEIKLKSNTNRCMHKYANGNYNGNNIQEYDCNGHSNSKFTYNIDEGKIYTVDDVRFTLHKTHDDCGNDNSIHVWDKNGGSLNQVWTSQ